MKKRLHAVATERIFAVMVAISLLPACVSQSGVRPDTPPLENHPPWEIADMDILHVSEAMAAFVRQHTPRDMKHANLAFNLAYTSLDSNFLDFHYDSSKTLTAEEAFRQKTGNCLSFSGMIVAMARVAGLSAWYQQVEVRQEWDSINDTLLVSKHVNAVLEDSHLEYVIDITPKYRTEETRNRNVADEKEWRRKLSDQEAFAQFYNNLGVNALIDNQLAPAHAYFAKAIETDPDTAFFWSNIGVVYRRNGQMEDASLAYTQSLELDSTHTVALNNLHALYLELGDEAAAREIQARAERHRRQNPYYLQQLSLVAIEEERYKDAVALIKRAIKIKEADYRFHLTMARSLFLLGETDEAQLSLDRARQLAPSDDGLQSLSLADLDQPDEP